MTDLTPCIGVCRLDEGRGICVGCGRLPHEIYNWMNLDEQTKLESMFNASARLERLIKEQ